MTLWIVGDNQAMRQMIKKLAADLTEGITECSEGAQAVEACRHLGAWMDTEMKVMNGLTVTGNSSAVRMYSP